MQNSCSNIPNAGMRGEGQPPFTENTGGSGAFNAEEKHSEITHAGFWVRLGAYMIDSFIVFAGLLIVRFVMWIGMFAVDNTFLGGNILFHYTLKDIVLYAVQVLYFILCTYYTGTTPGKRAMNLRVVNADDSKKLTFMNVVYRETVGRFLSGFLLGIGYIMIGIDKEKRGLHDFLCDTRVVYGRKVKIYPVYQKPVQPYRPVQPQRPVPPQMTVPRPSNDPSFSSGCVQPSPDDTPSKRQDGQS